MKISDMRIKHFKEHGVDYFSPQVKFMWWCVTLKDTDGCSAGGYGVGEYPDYVSFHTRRECEAFCKKYTKQQNDKSKVEYLKIR